MCSISVRLCMIRLQKKLDLATSVTDDVKTKKIENAIPEISGLNYDIYMNGNDIVVEFDSNMPQNIKIYDISGRMVYSSDFVRNTTIDKSGFDNGVYIVRLTDTNGKVSKNIKIVL